MLVAQNYSENLSGNIHTGISATFFQIETVPVLVPSVVLVLVLAVVLVLVLVLVRPHVITNLYLLLF